MIRRSILVFSLLFLASVKAPPLTELQQAIKNLEKNVSSLQTPDKQMLQGSVTDLETIAASLPSIHNQIPELRKDIEQSILTVNEMTTRWTKQKENLTRVGGN